MPVDFFSSYRFKKRDKTNVHFFIGCKTRVNETNNVSLCAP